MSESGGREGKRRTGRTGTQVLPRKSRDMYSRFLESDYPEALVLAEQALAEDPADAVAQAIYAECCKQLRQHDTLPAPPEALEDGESTLASLDTEDATFDSGKTESGREMYRRFLESDYPQALALAEQHLASFPEDPMALAIAHESRAAIELRKSVPVLRRTLGAPRELGAREALMLARVDGVSTVGEITDQSGLPPTEALHLMEELFEAGVLELRTT